MNAHALAHRPSLTISAGLIGNVMEWYDFAIYGYFAAILGKLYFPSEDPMISLIAAFGTFAVGFLTRPLGGLLLGRLGDTQGRQKALSLSVLCMAVPTMLIACIPTYDHIGVWAPVLLILMRVIQGLSVGGEYTSSLVFLAENSAQDRRAYTSIWGLWGAVLGMLLGSVVGWVISLSMSPDALELWGWRLPFAVGGVVAWVGWSIRRRLPAEVHMPRSASPVGELLTRYRGPLLRIVLINVGGSVAFYTVFVYALTFIKNIDHFSQAKVFEINTVSMLVMLLALPVKRSA